ncbi:hypothetical protein [Aliikangiella maris]|uniref:Lipoprotein n=2 Tax=Aliikangiella maris TaxID=3162458 RepID=A0ABV2BXM2_9GAMM
MKSSAKLLFHYFCLFTVCNIMVGCTHQSLNRSGLFTKEASSTQFLSKNQQVIPLINYQLEDGFILITTTSYGCTVFDSFDVKVASLKNNSLAVVRQKVDNCAMTTRPIELRYSYKHLGLDLARPISVINPLIKNPES